MYGAAVAVIMLHMVLQVLLLGCMVSQSRSMRHMGIMVTVVVPCGVAVMVAVVMPHGATAAVIVVMSSLDHKRGS
jgi:hypothetical protein